MSSVPSKSNFNTATNYIVSSHELNSTPRWGS